MDSLSSVMPLRIEILIRSESTESLRCKGNGVLIGQGLPRFAVCLTRMPHPCGLHGRGFRRPLSRLLMPTRTRSLHGNREGWGAGVVARLFRGEGFDRGWRKAPRLKTRATANPAAEPGMST